MHVLKKLALRQTGWQVWGGEKRGEGGAEGGERERREGRREGGEREGRGGSFDTSLAATLTINSCAIEQGALCRQHWFGRQELHCDDTVASSWATIDQPQAKRRLCKEDIRGG